MEFKIGYRVQNVVKTPPLPDVRLDGEIGARFDRFCHERISGQFAINEILRETEECFRDKFDDEFCAGKWRGEFWGKQILSAVRVCRMKNDPALKEDIRASAYRILSCQQADGYLGTYKNGDSVFPADINQAIIELGWECNYNWNIWGQKYTLWALLECALLLDERYILACCERMADHILSLMDRLGARVKDTGVMHGMASCSILKPMLLLYRLTGRQEYLDFCLKIAFEWERGDGECPNLITNALGGVPPEKWYDGEWYPKAYEMTSCFDGLIELYRVTGEGLYLKAAKAFWEMLKKHESNILGSVGYCERYASAASYQDSATEICDVLHWMRLSHELFMLTGEAKYMEAFEKAFLNAFLAGIYEDGRGGAFFVRAAGRHSDGDPQVETKYQHCCVNNAARGFTNAAESAMTECADGYMVNLWMQSRVRFGKTNFRITAGYIDRGSVSIIAREMEAGKKLYLRIPEWSKETVLVRNGEETILRAAGTYYAIDLPAGDSLTQIRFDMTPEVIDLTGVCCGNLPADDYHAQRWVDTNQGPCGKTLLLTHPMSVVRRGPVMLARSKKLGCSEEEMFSGETVHGKQAACAAQMILHGRLQTACRVTLTTADGEKEYLMCDVASAANKSLEDAKYFTMYV